MNNNRNQRMNGNRNNDKERNRNNNNNAPRRAPVFRPNVINEDGEQISFFIPRVDFRTSFEKVNFIFHHYFIGKVNKVDFVLKKDKNRFDYKAAYVHFDHFYNNENCCMFVDTVRELGLEGIYCDKYDRSKKWMVFINSGKKHVVGRPKERLNTGLLEAQVNVSDNNVSTNIFNEEKDDYNAYLAKMKATIKAARGDTQSFTEEDALKAPVVDYDNMIKTKLKNLVEEDKYKNERTKIANSYAYLPDYGDDAQGRQCRGW
jgi:hypothetical protein